MKINEEFEKNQTVGFVHELVKNNFWGEIMLGRPNFIIIKPIISLKSLLKNQCFEKCIKILLQKLEYEIYISKKVKRKALIFRVVLQYLHQAFI